MNNQLGLHLDAPPRLDPEALRDADARAVARALRWGRDNARQVSSIARAAGLPGRRAQDVMQRLLLEHHWPVGTAMSAPFGNYLIDSPAELSETVALLRTRGISNLARAAALQHVSLARLLDEVQTTLHLDTEER